MGSIKQLAPGAERSSRRGISPEVLPLLVLLGIILLVFWPYILIRPTPLMYPVSELGSDLPREIWPLARFVADAWHQEGIIPLWRPYLLGGAPLAGHAVAPILYPPHWLVLVLPLPLALNLDALLHLWWAAAGMFFLLRKAERLSQASAFAGALAFGLAPSWIARLSGGHWPMMAAIAWLPWAWLAARQLEGEKWLANVSLLGIALAAQAINHGAIFLMTSLWLGAQTTGRFLISPYPRSKVVFARWLLGVCVAMALSSGQLLPLMEILPLASRFTMTPAEATFASLRPALLAGILLPPELKFPELYIFPGVSVLLLACSVLQRGASKVRPWIWTILYSLGLALFFSVRPIAEGLSAIPLFSILRIPSRWSMFGLLGLAVLAAYGAEAWLSGCRGDRSYRGVLLVALVAFYLLMGLSAVVKGIAIPFETTLPAVMAALFFVVYIFAPPRVRLYGLIALLLFETYGIAKSLVRPESEEVIREEARRMRQILGTGADAARVLAPYGGYSFAALADLGWRAADGYDPLHLSHYSAVLNEAIGCEYPGYVVAAPATRASAAAANRCDTLDLEDGILWMLDIRYLLLPEDLNVEDLIPLARMGNMRWFEREGGSAGRAFSVSSVKLVSSQACASELEGLDLRKQAIIEEPLPDSEGFNAFRIDRIEAGSNYESFRVLAVSPGIFIRSETWAPGWKVEVDGVRMDVLRVNCALQGVWLEPGEHVLRFFYAPASFSIGLGISVVTALALLGVAVWHLVGRWRARLIVSSKQEINPEGKR